MSYIGIPPQANFSSGLLDRFTSTTGTTVTLTHDIASENDIVVFVNFVKQDSTTYSVGGTGNKTLTLGGTLVSSDIVEVHYLNIVGQTVNPSANSVGSSQLTADVITGQTALAVAPDSTDELLISDGGTLKRIDVSLIGGDNTPAFEGYSTNGQAPSDATETKVELDGESFDTDSAFDTSTYRFTVPSGEGGKYYVYGNIAVDSQADSTLRYAYIRIKKNGSTDLLDSYYNFTDNNPRDVAILVHGTVTLSAGDYIELYGYMDDTANSGLDFKGASGTRLATLMGGYKLIGV